MPVLTILLALFTRPHELRSQIQFWLWHETKRDITAMKEHPSSGWDRPSMRRCWEFLDMTSRSFAAVIKELDGDLARTICLFYLVLRGLDTIEDDMTLSDEVKQPILRSFHEKLSQDGWTFDGNGPKEKDRQLLVEFNVVIEELKRLDPASNAIITDICQKMETGMADFAHKAATTSEVYLEKVEDFDLYCHYVAGLVGEGLSRLFSASGKEADWLGDQLVLSNSMGYLLQKTNILRDYREDVDEQRYFWPREIWGKHGFKELSELKDPANKERALWALSGMTLDALRHATDALDYLTMLKNQTVFNFCAIPATMAIATIDLCFMNPLVFERNIKIRKGQALQLIMQSTNPRDVAYIFRDYARSIHKKASRADPNFLRISIACGKIEAWCEHHYPSFIEISKSSLGGMTQKMNPADARARIVERDLKRQQEEKRAARAGQPSINDIPQTMPWELVTFVGLAFLGVCLFSGGVIWAVIYFFGDKLE